MHLFFVAADDEAVMYFDILLNALPEQVREKILKYRQPKDRTLVLLGRLLLQESLRQADIPLSLGDVQIDRHGRPYVMGDVDFNISHSGGYSVCAFARSCRIGVDIERKRDIEVEAFKKHMTEEQWADITSHNDQKHQFFHYWTLKESVLKADGRGMSASLLSVVTTAKDEALLEHRRWFVRTINIDPDYMCHLASNKPIDNLWMQRLRIIPEPPFLMPASE